MNIGGIIKKFNTILNKKQKLLGIVVLFCSLVGAIFETICVSAIMPFTDILLNPEPALKKNAYVYISDLFHLESGTELLVFLAILVAILYLIKNVYFIFLSWIRAKYSSKVERELSIAVMENYMSRGYEFFINTNTGTLLRSIQTDVNHAYMFLYNSMRLITDFCIVACIAVYIIYADWQLAVGVCIMAALCSFLVAVVFSKINLKAGKDSRKYSAKSNQVLLQAVQGIKEVLVLKKDPFFVKEYKKYYSKHIQADLLQVIYSEIPAYMLEGSCVAAVFFVICVRIMNEGVTASLLSTLAAFVVAAFRILPSIGKLVSEYSALNYYYASLEAVYNNFKDLNSYRNSQLSEKTNARDSVCRTESVKLKDGIVMRDIVFAYDNSNIINHLNMDIKKGEAVAFIGPSGSGKTTLSDIILGLLQPQAGEVLIDGKISINSVPILWSQMVGYVSQTMYLADETIRFNVAFGVEEKDIDDARVWECLRKAHIDDYVRGLEDTIYTEVGDRGVKFSGGQRQRIAIARALYHKPQILVLDEATSALDNETENEVMESIEELQGEITLIIIAHRLSTIKKCDRIYEIINGVAIEKNKDEMDFI